MTTEGSNLTQSPYALADSSSLVCSCGVHAFLHDVLTEKGEARRYGPKPIMGVPGLTSP
jgi:hypothetical protein